MGQTHGSSCGSSVGVRGARTSPLSRKEVKQNIKKCKKQLQFCSRIGSGGGGGVLREENAHTPHPTPAFRRLNLRQIFSHELGPHPHRRLDPPLSAIFAFLILTLNWTCYVVGMNRNKLLFIMNLTDSCCPYFEMRDELWFLTEYTHTHKEKDFCLSTLADKSSKEKHFIQC